MFRKILYSLPSLLSLIILAMPFPASAAPAATLYLSPGCGPVYNGNNLTLDIHEDSGSTAVNTVQTDLTYSSAQFDVVSLTVASGWTEVQNDTSTPGSILFAAFPSPPGSSKTGDQVVATAVFQAKTNTGAATVNFANTSAVTADDGLGTDILTSTSGGMFPQGLAHVCGSLVKVSNSVYMIYGGGKHRFSSKNVLISYGFSWSWVASNMTSAEQSLPTGSAVPFREGTLIQGSGTAVYVVDNSTGVSIKRHISSPSVFKGLGYTSEDVIRVSDSELPASGSNLSSASAHPAGTMVYQVGSSAIYLIDHGSKRKFSNRYTLTTNGYSFANVKKATSADLALPTIGKMTLRPGALVQGSTSSVYVVDVVSGMAQKRRISGPTTLSRLGYTSNSVVKVPDSILPSATGQTL